MQLLVNIILVVNVFVCVALVCVVLLQRSEGGALGMGGGGGPSGFMTARGAGDLLTRTTWILAFIFFFLSITETVLTGKLHGGVSTLVDHINANSIDLSAPAKPGAAPALPGAAPSSAPPALQAPAPQLQSPQAPAQPTGADALSALSAASTPASKSPTPPASAQAPQKK